MRAVAQRYSEGTLQRLAINGDRVTRRAATLALGLIGSHGSTEVLGQALHDVDRAVRVVAEDGLRSLWARAVGPAGVYAIARISRWNFGHLYDLAADGCQGLPQAVARMRQP